MRILFWVSVGTTDVVLSRISPAPGAREGRAFPGPAPCRSYLAFLVTAAARRRPPLLLLDDLGHHSRADRAAALADREAQPLVHGDRLDQLDLHLHVVAGHHHLRALRQPGDPGHVGGAEVELRAVPGEERRVAPALLLLEHVHL